MRVYTAIRLPFLFHTSTISYKSLSGFLGDSMTVFKVEQAKFKGNSKLISCLTNFISLML